MEMRNPQTQDAMAHEFPIVYQKLFHRSTYITFPFDGISKIKERSSDQGWNDAEIDPNLVYAYDGPRPPRPFV